MKNNDFDSIFEDFYGYRNHKLFYDTYEHKNDFYIDVMLPGFEKEKIKLDYGDKKLTIKAEREKNEDYDYHRTSSVFGKLIETFKLSFEPKEINAEYDNGVLKIKLIKNKENTPKIIFN